MTRKISRRRGASLTAGGFQKLQAARTAAELAANFGDRYTKEELARLTGLSLKTISKIFDRSPDLGTARAITVDKQTLDLCFAAFNLILERRDYLYPDAIETTELAALDAVVIPARSPVYIDWGEAPDVSVFYGRVAELSKLTQWVRCRTAVS